MDDHNHVWIREGYFDARCATCDRYCHHPLAWINGRRCRCGAVDRGFDAPEIKLSRDWRTGGGGTFPETVPESDDDEREAQRRWRFYAREAHHEEMRRIIEGRHAQIWKKARHVEAVKAGEVTIRLPGWLDTLLDERRAEFSDKEFAALVCYEGLGLSQREAADVAGIRSYRTFRHSLERAQRKVRRLLGPDPDAEKYRLHHYEAVAQKRRAHD